MRSSLTLYYGIRYEEEAVGRSRRSPSTKCHSPTESCTRVTPPRPPRPPAA